MKDDKMDTFSIILLVLSILALIVMIACAGAIL